MKTTKWLVYGSITVLFLGCLPIAGAAEEKPAARFSHTSHLETNLARCTDCHLVENDYRIPDKQVCKQCHDDAFVPQIGNARWAAGSYFFVKQSFSHENHMQRTDNCLLCHESATRVGAERRDLYPDHSTCIKCHGMGFGASEGCTKCHRPR